jgi:hypothetical protein
MEMIRNLHVVILVILALNLVGYIPVVNAQDYLIEMTYSSFVGGSDYDLVHSMAVDSNGNIIIAGVTQSFDYPVLNSFQSESGGGGDSFLTKFSPDGQEIIFSTYMGGSAIDILNHVAVDSQDNIIVSGETHSSDFPIYNPYQEQLNGTVDSFLMKFNPEGNIQYSTFFGGSGYEVARALMFDSEDNLIFSGHTTSTDFPISSDAFQFTLSGSDDAFIVHFSEDGQSIIHSTFLGGSSTDGCNYAFFDDNCYVMCGLTDSTDFPITENAYQSTAGGASDCFISVFNIDEKILEYSSYLGASSRDYAWRIGKYLDSGIIVVGYTNSSDFPVTNNAYQTTIAGERDAFLMRFNSDMTLNFSSFIGGISDDEIRHFAVNPDGNIIIVGTTDSDDFPTTPNATQSEKDSFLDSYITIFDPMSQELLYSSFLGGRRNDYIWGIHLDTSIVIAGSTESSDFPVLNSYQESKAGLYDAYICKYNLNQPTTTTSSTTLEDWSPDVLLPAVIIVSGVVLIIIVLVHRRRRG